MRQDMSERERQLDLWFKFLTAVETNDCTTVQHMRGQFSDQKLGTALVDATRFNSVDVVAELLTNPKQDILMYVHDALMQSAEKGHAEILDIVLQHTDPARVGCYNLALWGALVHNHSQCVDMLFDWCNPEDVVNIAHERRAKPNAAWGVFEQRVAARQKTVLAEEVEHSGGARGLRKM